MTLGLPTRSDHLAPKNRGLKSDTTPDHMISPLGAQVAGSEIEAAVRPASRCNEFLLHRTSALPVKHGDFNRVLSYS